MYDVVQGLLESERATTLDSTWQSPTDVYMFDDTTLHHEYEELCTGAPGHPFLTASQRSSQIAFGGDSDRETLLTQCTQTGAASCSHDPQCLYVMIWPPGIGGTSVYTCYKFHSDWSGLTCSSTQYSAGSADGLVITVYQKITERRVDAESNFELPQHWTYYNPLTAPQRSWTCGFVEVFHEMDGEWGKVCMRKDGATRAVGRLLGKATCSGIRKNDGSTPTSFEEDNTEVHDNVLSVVGPDSTEERNGLFTSFADLNRGLLSGQLNGYLDPSSSTYHVQGSRRSGEAHHFAQWEGEKKPRRPDVQRPSVFQPVADEAREVEWKSPFTWTPSTSFRVNYKNAYCPVSKPLTFDEAGLYVTRLEVPQYGPLLLRRRTGEPCFYFDASDHATWGCIVVDEPSSAATEETLKDLKAKTTIDKNEHTLVDAWWAEFHSMGPAQVILERIKAVTAQAVRPEPIVQNYGVATVKDYQLAPQPNWQPERAWWPGVVGGQVLVINGVVYYPTGPGQTIPRQDRDGDAADAPTHFRHRLWVGYTLPECNQRCLDWNSGDNEEIDPDSGIAYWAQNLALYPRQTHCDFFSYAANPPTDQIDAGFDLGNWCVLWTQAGDSLSYSYTQPSAAQLQRPSVSDIQSAVRDASSGLTSSSSQSWAEGWNVYYAYDARTHGKPWLGAVAGPASRGLGETFYTPPTSRRVARA